MCFPHFITFIIAMRKASAEAIKEMHVGLFPFAVFRREIVGNFSVSKVCD